VNYPQVTFSSDYSQKAAHRTAAVSQWIAVLTLVLLASSCFYDQLEAQSVRFPRDSVGFCWDRDEMTRLISFLEKDNPFLAQSFDIVAGISPHDDYLYAGRVYYPLMKSLKADEVIIFGVTHGTVRREIGDPKDRIILETFSAWKGSGEAVPISPLRDMIRANLDTTYRLIDNRAHSLEHSIEALVPFLQVYHPNVRITPIMITAMSFSRMEEISSKLADIIVNYAHQHQFAFGRDIAILISSDANHYGRDFNNVPFGEDEKAHRIGTSNDRQIISTCLEGPVTKKKIQALTDTLRNVVWCGKYSVPFGLLTTLKIFEKISTKHLGGKLLRYSDTFTEGVLPLHGTTLGITAPFSLQHWVGFGSVAFYLDQ
jgi:AmmeMemoRadiSam system protein B